MPALDFPTSPTNGQIYEGYVYDSSLPGWRSKGGAVAAIYTSDTAPSGAVKGDMWFRTSDGTTYVYVVDADTSQWVEIRSEISTLKVGLVPVIPTSITVGSGTASVAADGLVTFTNCNYFDIINSFSATYANYKIIIETLTASVADSSINYVLVTSGGTANGSNFSSQRLYAQNTSLGTTNGTGANTGTLGVITGLDCSMDMTIYRPFKTQYTLAQAETVYLRNEASVMKPFIEKHYSALADTASYSTIRFYDPSASISGKLRIYGYN